MQILSLGWAWGSAFPKSSSWPFQCVNKSEQQEVRTSQWQQTGSGPGKGRGQTTKCSAEEGKPGSEILYKEFSCVDTWMEQGNVHMPPRAFRHSGPLICWTWSLKCSNAFPSCWVFYSCKGRQCGVMPTSTHSLPLSLLVCKMEIKTTCQAVVSSSVWHAIGIYYMLSSLNTI